MALSKQMCCVSTLVEYVRWAQSAGYSIGEMYGFSTVHPVHAVGSWHYDSEGGFGKAADINSNGAGEMARLSVARQKAESMGLAVTLAEKGPVAGHADHLHVDVGLLSNLGQGIYHARGDGYPAPAAGASQSGASTVAPPSLASPTTTQEDDMPTLDEIRAVVADEIARTPREDRLQIVAALFTQYLGAPPTGDELVGWDTTLRANPEWDGEHIRSALLALPADRRAVIAAYRALLPGGRSPESEAVIATWVQGRSIGKVWADIRAMAAAGAR